MTIPSEGNCITSCTPGAPFPVTITLGAPLGVFCDEFIVPVTIAGPTVTVGPGILLAKYIRTWTELSATGAPTQVWRFLVNSDLTYVLSATSTTPCPVPKTAFGGISVHLCGQLDYARVCPTGPFTASISLSHLCGDFEHNTWSPKAISPNPNPDTVYAFVGPLPFLWGGGPPASGPVIGDAVRSTAYSFTATPSFWTCLSEGPVVAGDLANIAPYCPCSAPGGVGISPWTQQALSFLYSACPAVAPMAFGLIPFPPLVPTGLSALPLGTWVLPPTTFPGTRRLHHYFGLASSPDPCVSGSLPFHIVNGVMTSGATGNVIPPPPNTPFTSTVFLDLENTMILISGPPFITIGFGGFFLATRVWSLNCP